MGRKRAAPRTNERPSLFFLIVLALGLLLLTWMFIRSAGNPPEAPPVEPPAAEAPEGA